MNYSINNFNELIRFFERPEVTVEQIEEITAKSLYVFFIGKNTKEDAIKQLIKFWDKWGETREKPIFIDLDLNVID